MIHFKKIVSPHKKKSPVNAAQVKPPPLCLMSAQTFQVSLN